jgi:hypothetical protein
VNFVINSPLTKKDPTGLWQDLDPQDQPPNPGAGTIGNKQKEFAALSCIGSCPWVTVKAICGRIGALGKPSPEEIRLNDKMHQIYQMANIFATNAIVQLGVVNDLRNHSALRHCHASGHYANLLGCRCAGCLGYFREVYQNEKEGQPVDVSRRTDFNNAIGRRCAGCTGGKSISESAGRPVFDIGECCKKAFLNGELWLGSDQPADSDDVPYGEFPYVPPPDPLTVMM